MWKVECGINVTLRFAFGSALIIRYQRNIHRDSSDKALLLKTLLVQKVTIAAYNVSFCECRGAERRVPGCQFAGVAPLRSALHSYRTFITRGLNFIGRCGTPPQADGRSVYNKYRSRLTKHPYECRVSGANDYANCTKCKGPGSLLPGGAPGRAAPGGSGARVSSGHLSAAG